MVSALVFQFGFYLPDRLQVLEQLEAKKSTKECAMLFIIPHIPKLLIEKTLHFETLMLQ